jgi:hypothetical protein
MIRGDVMDKEYENLKNSITWFTNIDKDCSELDIGLSNLVRNKNINTLLKKLDNNINNIMNNIDLSGNIYEVYFSQNNKEISYLLNELLYNNKYYIFGSNELNIDCIKCDIIDYDIINQCSTILIHGEGEINIDKIKCKIINI